MLWGLRGGKEAEDEGWARGAKMLVEEVEGEKFWGEGKLGVLLEEEAKLLLETWEEGEELELLEESDGRMWWGKWEGFFGTVGDKGNGAEVEVEGKKVEGWGAQKRQDKGI